MASEYLKWKYRDVKPEEKTEMTPEQKRRNWWEYHKWWLLLALVFVVGAGFLIHDIFFRPVPDYEVGFVSKIQPPTEVLEALQAQLEAQGEDVNGDGRVLVELDVYSVGFDPLSMTDADATSAAITRLTVDLSSGQVYLLLLDDPEGFQARMGALCYLDGSIPPDDAEKHDAANWTDMVYRWEDCPVLAGMDLGTYQPFLGVEGPDTDGQSAMAGIYVARRALWTEEQAAGFTADEDLWQKLTAGAVQG